MKEINGFKCSRKQFEDYRTRARVRITLDIDIFTDAEKPEDIKKVVPLNGEILFTKTVEQDKSVAKLIDDLK